MVMSMLDFVWCEKDSFAICSSSLDFHTKFLSFSATE